MGKGGKDGGLRYCYNTVIHLDTTKKTSERGWQTKKGHRTDDETTRRGTSRKKRMGEEREIERGESVTKIEGGKLYSNLKSEDWLLNRHLTFAE